MPLTAGELRMALGDLQAARARESGRLHRIRQHLRDQVTGQRAGVYVPARATREYRLLVEQARFNVLELVVTAVAQNLYVEGYHRSAEPGPDNAQVWGDVWQPNRMDARQAGIFRAAIAYGYSYSTVLPGDPAPVITPVSPMHMTALYDDPINGEWPEIAAQWLGSRTVGGDEVQVADLFDSEQVYRVYIPADGAAPIVVKAEEHDAPVVPVVRFRNRFELEGSLGKVEPLIPIQQQLHQTTFSLLMAQQFGAFRQRHVTGMEIQEDENGNPLRPFNAAVDQVFQAESPDTKFGEFGQTDLGGFLASRDKALLHVASVAQIPPHNLLTGAGISNISAEALTALEAGHRQDIAEHQHSLGEAVEQMLRLAARIGGDEDTWEDRSAQVRWGDTAPRSLAQIGDYLTKLATSLGVPLRALWEMIPGMTDQTLARWESMAGEDDLLGNLAEIVGGNDTGGGLDDAEPSGPPADVAASA